MSQMHGTSAGKCRAIPTLSTDPDVAASTGGEAEWSHAVKPRRRRSGGTGSHMLLERQSELDALTAELDYVRQSGRPAVALLLGEAGIGKTALAAEAVRGFAESGAITTSGRADPFDRGMPFAIFRDVMSNASLSSVLDSDLLNAAREGLRQPLDEAWRHTEVGSAPAFDRVLASLTEVARALTAEATTVILLEDLDLADPDSIALFGCLIRQLMDRRVFFIATMRGDRHDRLAQIAGFVRRLAEQSHAVTLTLPPLSRSAIVDLTTDVLGHQPHPDLAAIVHERSHGNPFFATQLTQQLVGDGRVQFRGRWAVLTDDPDGERPPRPAFAVDRFFRPDSDELAVARALSIFGRFTLAHLDALTELSHVDRDQVVACFDRMVAGQLLTRTTNGSYEFAHTILKDALAHSLGDAARHDLHRSLAALMTIKRDAGLPIDLFELATHIVHSAEPGDQQAAAICLEAAALAFGDAPLASADWLHSALTFMSASDGRRLDIRIRQVYALMTGSDTLAAIEVGRVGLAEAPVEPRRAALVVAAARSMSANNRLSDAERLLSAEIRQGVDTPAMRAQRGLYLLELGHPKPARLDQLISTETVETAEESLSRLSYLLGCFICSGDPAALRQTQQNLIRLLPSLAPHLRSHALASLALTRCQGIGELEVAEANLVDARLGMPRSARASMAGYREIAEAVVGWMRGRWDTVLSEGEIALDALVASGSTVFAEGIRAVMTIVRTDQGVRDSSQIVTGGGPHLVTTQALVATARARLLQQGGYTEDAITLLRAELHTAMTIGAYPFVSLLADELVTLQLLVGEQGRAAASARQVLDFVQPLGWPLLNSFALRAGASATGDVDMAREAAAAARTAGAVVELAKCQLLLATLGYDPVGNLVPAFEVFDRISAFPWRTRTSRALREVGAAAPRRSGRPGELTETESELARLVTEGFTNRQVAKLLNYSTKTIEVYLSRVYAKTGYSSRVELTRAVFHGDLRLHEQPQPELPPGRSGVAS